MFGSLVGKTALIKKYSASLDRFLQICFELLWISLLCAQSIQAQNTLAIPHLQKQGTATQLIVHDKPFLMLGGGAGKLKRVGFEVYGTYLAEVKSHALEYYSDAGLLGAY
jgi:hypothetical protein